MQHPVTVTIHPSCFPDRARAAYLESYRARRMNHRFHYESEKQAQQWLAIHEAYSPARTDPDCLHTYDRALSEIAANITSDSVALISIGCGGGQKDQTLMNNLQGKRLIYFPIDVSLPLALTAHLRASKAIQSTPVILDLSGALDFPDFLDTLLPAEGPRLFAFFGMLPNFHPYEILPTLSAALRPGDLLVGSANLAPAADYLAGVNRILPLYDNELTRRWLATTLLDAGLDVRPSDIKFFVVEHEDLLRVDAVCSITASQTIRIGAEELSFPAGEPFHLFFSYRYTPTLLRRHFAKHNLQITREWITASAEEGIFLSEKS